MVGLRIDCHFRQLTQPLSLLADAEEYGPWSIQVSHWRYSRPLVIAVVWMLNGVTPHEVPTLMWELEGVPTYPTLEWSKMGLLPFTPSFSSVTFPCTTFPKLCYFDGRFKGCLGMFCVLLSPLLSFVLGRSPLLSLGSWIFLELFSPLLTSDLVSSDEDNSLRLSCDFGALSSAFRALASQRLFCSDLCI